MGGSHQMPSTKDSLSRHVDWVSRNDDVWAGLRYYVSFTVKRFLPKALIEVVHPPRIVAVGIPTPAVSVVPGAIFWFPVIPVALVVTPAGVDFHTNLVGPRLGDHPHRKHSHCQSQTNQNER